MKDRYTKTFSISANTHNIPAHDAILLTSNDKSAGIGVSFSAEVHTYAVGTKTGSHGRPYGTDGVTGSSIILRGTKTDRGSTDLQIIFPVQIKSVSGITAGNLYGLI